MDKPLARLAKKRVDPIEPSYFKNTRYMYRGTTVERQQKGRHLKTKESPRRSPTLSAL